MNTLFIVVKKKYNFFEKKFGKKLFDIFLVAKKKFSL
jgi:hypothetical protein